MSDFLDLHGQTSKALRALAERAMQRHGLHLGQNLLLDALTTHDGQTPGDVAQALHVSTPTVVKMATRMAAAGWLTRVRDERDHRLVRLWLTPAGRAKQGPIERARRRLDRQVTADLTDTERRLLLRALKKVHQTASRLLRQSPGI